MKADSRNGQNGNGRDRTGRFMPGNGGGPGRPPGCCNRATATAMELKAALAEALTPEDIRAIMTALVDRAKTGDVAAAREVLDRSVGKTHTGIEIEMNTKPTPPDRLNVVLCPESQAILDRLNARAREALDACDAELRKDSDGHRPAAQV